MSFQEIPGLCWRNGDGMLERSPCRASADIDDLPVDVLEEPNACFQISTIRGCPYHCFHCVEHDSQGKVRYMSAERLLAIMEERLRLTGNNRFFFQDDTFLAAPGRLEHLHALMSRKNMMGRFRIESVSLNANLVKEHTLGLLRDIGVQALGMGVESLSVRILREMKGGLVSIADVERTIHLAEKEGLPIGGSQVYGFPGETRAEMMESIERVRHYEATTKFRHWVAYVCQPLPGSRYWQRELEAGRVSLDMDFSRLRMDGDCRYLQSPWYYGNEAEVPLEDFVDLITRHALSPEYYFGGRRAVSVAEPQTRPAGRFNLSEISRKVAEHVDRCRSAAARVVVYGLGEHTAHLFKWTSLAQAGIVALSDRNPRLWGESLWGYPVIPPHEIEASHCDVVLISSEAFEAEIFTELTTLLPPRIRCLRLYAEEAQTAAAYETR